MHRKSYFGAVVALRLCVAVVILASLTACSRKSDPGAVARFNALLDEYAETIDTYAARIETAQKAGDAEAMKQLKQEFKTAVDRWQSKWQAEVAKEPYIVEEEMQTISQRATDLRSRMLAVANAKLPEDAAESPGDDDPPGPTPPAAPQDAPESP